MGPGWGGRWNPSPTLAGQGPRHWLLPSVPSIEIDQKLQEIMKQTGYLTIGGQVLLRLAPQQGKGWTWLGWAVGVGSGGPRDPPAQAVSPALPGRDQRPREPGRDGQWHLRPGVADALPKDGPRHRC